MSKYHNKKILDFDSTAEMRRYGELCLLQRAGKISGLDRQVKFNLLPPQYDEEGKLVFKGVYYKADFVYW